MSYRKRHVKSKIHRIRPRKSVFKKLWFWIIILVLTIVSAGFYLLFFYSGLQVKNIVVLGNEKIKTQDLEELAFNNADINLLSFWNIKIVSRSILFVDIDKINNDILKKYSVVENAKISKKLPETLTLDITERKPIGAFCPSAGASTELSRMSSGQAVDQCFSIDNSGVIFGSAGAVPENTTIVRQLFNSGQVFTGEQVVAENIISAIYKIRKSLKDNFQIDLKEVLITSPLRINVKTNENWQIYFDLAPASDIGSQITKLNLLLSDEISADKRKNLRYVDLRPKDKAIVCDNSTCGE